jgi:hypothetical protein
MAIAEYSGPRCLTEIPSILKGSRQWKVKFTPLCCQSVMALNGYVQNMIFICVAARPHIRGRLRIGKPIILSETMTKIRHIVSTTMLFLLALRAC